MKTGSKFIRIFASLALLSLVAAVAACSSNSDSSSTNTPTSSSNSASGNAAAKNAGVTDRGYAHPERLVSATWLSEHDR